MKKLDKIKEFVAKQIKDLDYSLDIQEVKEVFENAVGFAEIATKKELVKYIEESLELLPFHLKGEV